MPHIALVDDDRNIVASLSLALKKEGFHVSSYADGRSALDALRQMNENDGPAVDIGIFDIKMPRMDGMELLRRLRETSDMPVIFLTSKDTEIEELMGLKIGADDYITKPFSQKLLIERIRVILRRNRMRQKKVNTKISDEKTPDDPAHKIIKCGALQLDVARHECLWRDKPVNITVTEFLILSALAQHPGFVKSRDALLNAAYDDEVYVDDRTIDSHIKRLRRKFRQQDDAFDAIETLYGVGYRFKETP